MKSTQSLLVLRLLLAMLAVVLPACTEDPTPTLRIGAFQRPGFEPLFLARNLGYLDEQRVQLVEFPSSADTLLAFRNNAIDGATVTTDDVLRLASEGLPVRIVLVMAQSNGVDAVLAKGDVNSVAALKGRTVAVESNALGGYVLARALDTAGLRLADVRIISSRSDRAALEITVGNANAVVTCEPYRSRIVQRGTKPIFDSAQLPDEITDVLIVRAPTAEQPPAALRELTTGWFRALDYLATHFDDATLRMAPREGMTPEQFRKALTFVKLVDLSENHRQLGPPASPLAGNMRRMMGFMTASGMLPHEVNPVPLRSASALPPLKQ